MTAPRKIATFDALLKEVTEVVSEAPPSLGPALFHCAQSIECSLDGYPKPAMWPIRALVGPLMLRKFLKQGFMRHDTSAPVPGLPPSGEVSPRDGLTKLEAAITRFRSHSGDLKPHFAFGQVSKNAYEAVHAMHAANHLDSILV